MSVMFLEFSCLLRIFWRDRPVVITSALLLAGVFCIVALYGLSDLLKDRSSVASLVHWEIGLSRDRSMGEIVNYGLAFLAAILFLLTFVTLRSPMYLVMSLLMAFIWLDDSAGYHERVGHYLAETFDLPAPPPLRREDVGELLAWSGAGIVLGVMFIFALRRCRPGDLGAFMFLSCCFGLLVLFGIATDMAHVAAQRDLDTLLSIIEDGGEMLATAMIAAVALGLGRNAEAYRAACIGQSPAVCRAISAPSSRPATRSSSFGETRINASVSEDPSKAAATSRH